MTSVDPSWPLFRIDATGHPQLLGRLHALGRDQYRFDSSLGEYPQLSEGLPFFLQDLIPEGFLGRAIPRRCADLRLPERVGDWNDEHVLEYLCRRGENCIGDLVLGNESLERYVEQAAAEPEQVEDREREFSSLAAAALAGGHRGSPAGGEHPKFTASVRQDDGIRHVLVKFSSDGADRGARRWSDLLVSEHLATQVLHDAGLTPTTTEILIADGRTFLEAQRFDRHSVRGRSGLVSLASLANQYLGTRDNWTAATASLAKMRLISHEDAETVRRLATFGRLIANTDMHFGNLSFHLSFDRKPALAPVYDMLPMLYAPTARDVTTREFEPPLPAAGNLDIWKDITALAADYWRQVSAHRDVSAEFATIAKRNADRVIAVAKLI